MRPGEDELRSGGNWLAGEDWTRLWESFQHIAFRLETLPEYRVAAERGRMELFLSGAPKPPGYGEGWHKRLREYRETGKHVRRVRVVGPELTDYQRREFAWAYPGNAEAGEEIRVLREEQARALTLPDQDFWLFDDQTVVLMRYEADGTQLGRERLIEAEPDLYARYGRTAWEAAVGLDEFAESLAD